MVQTPEDTRIDSIEERVTALEGSIARLRTRIGEGFSPRQLCLLLEAVEYYVSDVRTESDGEFRLLEQLLHVLTGQAAPPDTEREVNRMTE